MTRTATVMSVSLVRHLRTALFGATLVALEDVATVGEDLNREAGRPHPDQLGKRAAYHELMAVMRLHYEVQQAFGLPGEPAEEVELCGPGPHQAVVVEALTDYRDATVVLLGEGQLTDREAEQAAARIEVLNEFLGGGYRVEGQGGDVA